MIEPASLSQGDARFQVSISIYTKACAEVPARAFVVPVAGKDSGLVRRVPLSFRRMKQIIAWATLATLLAAGVSDAQVVKQEPFDGKMLPGAVILVDDGSCGKGKIKEVTGGEIGAMDPRPRTRRCIPRDRK
jgi:hypothetical protein